MASYFSGTNGLENSAPLSSDGTAPFTIGFWFKPFDANFGPAVFYITDPSVGDHLIGLYQGGSSNLNVEYQAPGGTYDTQIVGGYTTNTWNYAVLRGISTTNKRASILNGATQVISHASGTVTADVSGCTTMSIANVDILPTGPQAFSNVAFAEFFVANADVQSDGTQLQESTVRQLAYGGPFSIPSLRGNIREYMSFRSDPCTYLSNLHTAYRIDETYLGAGLTSTAWSAVGGSLPARFDHTPLPYSHANPTDHSRVLMI